MSVCQLEATAMGKWRISDMQQIPNFEFIAIKPLHLCERNCLVSRKGNRWRESKLSAAQVQLAIHIQTKTCVSSQTIVFLSLELLRNILPNRTFISAMSKSMWLVATLTLVVFARGYRQTDDSSQLVSNSTPLPVIFWHGMGDTCCGGLADLLTEIKKELGSQGVVRNSRLCLHYLGKTAWKSVVLNFKVNMSLPACAFCQQLTSIVQSRSIPEVPRAYIMLATTTDIMVISGASKTRGSFM